MKRVLIVLVALFVLIVLGSCNNENTEVVETIVEEVWDSSTPPSEDYVISCLEQIDVIQEIAAVTEDNDPNGNLNKEGYYISQVYFSVSNLDQDEIDGNDLIDKGTDAGGSVEVYSTEEDAQNRDEYLASFDGTWFDSGSHICIGTVVVRTSTELKASEQDELEEKIVYALTHGTIDLETSEVTDKSETSENKTDENSKKTNEESNEESIKIETDSEPQSNEIELTMGEDDFKGMSYQEAEESFRKMGFTEFEYRDVETEIESLANTICYIEITEWLFGDSSFVKGDKFDSDSTVSLFTYKYEAPVAPSPVFYSTNDYETAKKGDTGVFAYVDQGASYDIYWIIDFDEGYVYYFTDGNGESFCDRLKIDSGTLNDKITITYHDGGDTWSYKLHFKYISHPETLIMVDQNGFDWEYSTTDLEDALIIRSTKNIKDY